MPVNDTDGNGIPDWMERENSADELVTGTYSVDWPVTRFYTPTARGRRVNDLIVALPEVGELHHRYERRAA